MSKDELRHKDVWNGYYRGVSVEIVRWTAHDGTDIWNYYIALNMKSVPDEHRNLFDLPPTYNDKGRESYRYYDSIFARIDFPGGPTFYKKHLYGDGRTWVVTGGCDYNHAWDVWERYSVSDLRMDAARTVDSLIEQAPYLKVWCPGCDEYHKPPERPAVRVFTPHEPCCEACVATHNSGEHR